MTLDELALQHGTDKSSAIHNYAIKYEKYLPFNRKQKIKILEIGVLKGDSLRMWRDYYPNAEIHGLDIDPKCKELALEGIVIHIGSQVDEAFINEVVSPKGPFDLIIDDGSHVNIHVTRTFELLFQNLKSGGVYAVEDSCTSYWPKYGGSHSGIDTTMSFFKCLADDVSFHGVKAHGVVPSVSRRESVLIPHVEQYMPGCCTSIESINFLNSLILTTKR
jgi:hypothetical protein